MSYKERVAKGLCGIANCSEEPQPGAKICKTHKKLQAERAAAQRKKRAESGTCITAGCFETESLSAGGRCPKCLADQAAGRKKSSEKLMEQGLCRNAASHGKAKPGTTLCQDCINKLSATTSEHYRRQRENGLCAYIGCTETPANENGAYCQTHLDYLTDRRLLNKMEALNAYGGSACVWPECLITDPEQLTFDHTEGGGNKHRKEIGRAGGSGFIQWLKANAYPPGFRVLCHNHNHQAHRERCRKDPL